MRRRRALSRSASPRGRLSRSRSRSRAAAAGDWKVSAGRECWGGWGVVEGFAGGCGVELVADTISVCFQPQVSIICMCKYLMLMK